MRGEVKGWPRNNVIEETGRPAMTVPGMTAVEVAGQHRKTLQFLGR